MRTRRKVLLGIGASSVASVVALQDQIRCIFTPGWSLGSLFSVFGKRLHPITSIVVHHTGGRQFNELGLVNAAQLDAVHDRRGFCAVCGCRTYSIGYHFAVLADGTIETGRPEYCVGAHAGVRAFNDSSLGVAIVGDFSALGSDGVQPVSDLQLEAAATLLSRLLRQYDLTSVEIKLHRDVNPNTECPGRNFPVETLRQLVEERLAG